MDTWRHSVDLFESIEPSSIWKLIFEINFRHFITLFPDGQKIQYCWKLFLHGFIGKDTLLKWTFGDDLLTYLNQSNPLVSAN